MRLDGIPPIDMVHEKALFSDTMAVAICRPRAKVLAIRSRNASLILLSGHFHVRHSSSPWLRHLGVSSCLSRYPCVSYTPGFIYTMQHRSHPTTARRTNKRCDSDRAVEYFSGNSNLIINRIIARSRSSLKITVRPPCRMCLRHIIFKTRQCPLETSLLVVRSCAPIAASP